MASFTYIRELPNREKVERVFTSQYRALPKICLVGVEAVAEEPVIESTEGNSEEMPGETSPTEETSETEPVVPPGEVIEVVN